MCKLNYKVNSVKHSFYRNSTIINIYKENINSDKNDCMHLTEYDMKKSCHVR